MTIRAAQSCVRVVQREASVVRKVLQVVEVMLLAVARFATALHRTFVHILVALDASLRTPEKAQLARG